MLTVKQLRDMLNGYPDDAEVFYNPILGTFQKWVDLVIYTKGQDEDEEGVVELPLVATITIEKAPTEIRNLI